MKTNNDNLESLNLNIEDLLAEAAELIKMINSDVIKNMKEEHQIEFEQHAQNLERIKYEIQNRTEKTQNGTEKSGTEETESVASGAHEAIQDILEAMRGMTKYLS
ncbi:MAG: hypothetical protein HQK62_13150 [Desulfamplus sp.]|nr:hypothetical protein [Desulfamplus sp.]MBF0259758.1 hypothetical protein [Desulfamplus sp.]